MSAVLILGDSTSMTVGVEQLTYPFLLASAHVWPAGTRFINYSLPGFTSADAAACFFRYRKSWTGRLHAVIIFLGNCDTAGTEIRKGKFGYRRQAMCWAREITQHSVPKTRIKNRLMHFEWDNSYDPTIEVPEDPKNYEYNLGRIIAVCRRNSTPVILVRPKANLYFPPGVGKGNFVFYRYLGMHEKISELISIPDSRFKEAWKHHELKNFSEAAKIYREIMLKPSLTPMSQEYPLVALNNYAAAVAESGAVDEAVYLYKLLLAEPNSRKEIALYNLAQLEKNRGARNKYNEYLADSYEADSSLYRIRAPYHRALDRLNFRFPFVSTLDMNAILSDAHYLDHCHPLPEGQIILAKELQRHFGKLGITGTQPANIENVLYNPEISLGNPSGFHKYFLTFAPYTEEQIAQHISACKKIIKLSEVYSPNSPALASIPREIRSAIEYALRHPYFTSVTDVLHFPPRFRSDVGRFPEFFIIRTLIPYIREHESNPKLSCRFAPTTGLLRTSDQLLSILPAHTVSQIDSCIPTIDKEYELIRLSHILTKVRNLLIRHLETGNQIFERVKTTIYWYFREALRFGAHSRTHMLYDRTTLEFLAEGLAVAGVLDAATGTKSSGEIENLIYLITVCTEIHDKYCSKFVLVNNSENLLESYDRELAELATTTRLQFAV